MRRCASPAVRRCGRRAAATCARAAARPAAAADGTCDRRAGTTPARLSQPEPAPEELQDQRPLDGGLAVVRRCAVSALDVLLVRHVVTPLAQPCPPLSRIP